MLILKVVREEGSPQRHREHGEETAGENWGMVYTPRVFAQERQGKDLRDRESVRVAGKELTGGPFCAFAHDGGDLRLVTCDS